MPLSRIDRPNMIDFLMRKKFLVWFYTRIELLLTQGFRHFRNLAFAAAGRDFSGGHTSTKLITTTNLGGNVGIVITTFEQRFEIYAIPLINDLREKLSCPIYLVINGNYEGPAHVNSMTNLLRKISHFENVFPIVFGKMQGCSSLWNTGLAHSNCSLNFVFNDDISIDKTTMTEQMQVAVDSMADKDLLTINNSWSHYLISNRCLDSIGPFDERFLGFGEEDGDYIRRVVEKTGVGPANLLLPAFVNIIDQSRDPNVAVSWGKYSLFNKCLFHLKYPDSQIDSTFFSQPGAKSVLPDYDSRSLHAFRESLYPLLISDNPEEVIESILCFYH